MDKQTLSNYGWLVIVTLILAVMLALATPFGTYVGDAVVSVANGYVGASNNAMDNDNISNMEQQWADKLGSVSSKPEKLIAGATFTDGAFLTWEELQLEENGTKYGYKNSVISDTEIGEKAFWYCENLTSITIPSSVTTIGADAFRYCESLTSIIIPSSVTTLEKQVLYGCTTLTSINYEGTMDEWNAVRKRLEWNYNVPATEVICSDGTVSLK